MVSLTPMQHAGLIQAFSDISENLDVLVIDTAAGIGDGVVSFVRAAQEHHRDFTVDWVHLKLNDQAQRTVLCKDPFRSVDERVKRLGPLALRVAHSHTPHVLRAFDVDDVRVEAYVLAQVVVVRKGV